MLPNIMLKKFLRSGKKNERIKKSEKLKKRQRGLLNELKLFWEELKSTRLLRNYFNSWIKLVKIVFDSFDFWKNIRILVLAIRYSFKFSKLRSFCFVPLFSCFNSFTPLGELHFKNGIWWSIELVGNRMIQTIFSTSTRSFRLFKDNNCLNIENQLLTEQFKEIEKTNWLNLVLKVE